ncbi:MAG: CHAD domain-containing protein [Streptosporangiaceae bacterium]|nr:CHAD domain-containing protein [Streptosporangiaceae bacterium]
MASGLRGFVLDTEAAAASARTADDRMAAVHAALASAFTVTADRGARTGPARRRTWLDTFDWRLYRAGLALSYERARRGSRLVLEGDDGVPQATQPAPRWQPRRPRLAADLEAGPVRDRILALTSPRALLPVAAAVSTVSVSRLLNSDGKTVARLIRDDSTVTAAGHGPAAALPTRLAIAEVRGYPGQARRAARLVAGVPGVAPATQPVVKAALSALGLRPGDYSSGVDAEVTAQMPASAAVAILLLRLLDTLEANTDGVLRDIDTEFLHDLRVAVRRSRSAIKLLGDVLPEGPAEHYGAGFKWLGDLTTPTRDLDVHLLGFDATARQLLAATAADLQPFRAFLARRRAREFRRLATALRSARFRALADDWRKVLLEVRDAGIPGSRRGLTAAELAASRTARAFAKVARRGGAITPESPAESLHDLRKRCKELRYLLEFFAPLHDPAAYRKVVGDLKKLQDNLGEFQDSQVQREEIGALADAMLAEGAAPAATLLAMGEVAARLAASQAEAREQFGKRFAAFAGPAGQGHVRVLLGAAASEAAR